MHWRVTLISIAVQFSLATVTAAEEAQTATAPDGRAMTAKLAGAHYGQALGAIEVCPGATLTNSGKALETSYSGAARESFMAAAASVYQSWRKVRRCADTLDPNPCKIILDESCAAAAAEIGPRGRVLPGLVDFSAP